MCGRGSLPRCGQGWTCSKCSWGGSSVGWQFSTVAAPCRHGEPMSSVQECGYGSGGRQEAFFKGHLGHGGRCCDEREQGCFPSPSGAAAAPCTHISFRSGSSWVSLSGINQLPRLPWRCPFPCLNFCWLPPHLCHSLPFHGILPMPVELPYPASGPSPAVGDSRPYFTAK